MQNKESEKKSDVLLSCPFCGDRAYTYTSHNHEVGLVYLVHCEKCKINYPCDRACKTEQEAIEAWNRRV